MRFQYLINQAMLNLRRNVWLVVGAVLTVLVTMVLVFGSVIVLKSAENYTVRWKDGVRVAAFLADDLSLDEIDSLESEIRGWPDVDAIFYVSKAEAVDEFRVLFADEPDLIDLVEETPDLLPASFRVAPVDAENFAIIEDRLALTPGVWRVKSASESIETIVLVSQVVRITTWVLAIALGISAVVLIGNTIRLAIYARRDEISIMKLVGAGNWFVRVPFMLEGVIEGLIGGALAVGVVLMLYTWAGPQIGTALDVPSTLPSVFLLQRSMLIVAFGALTGILGSAIGMWGLMRD